MTGADIGGLVPRGSASQRNPNRSRWPSAKHGQGTELLTRLAFGGIDVFIRRLKQVVWKIPGTTGCDPNKGFS